MKLSLTSCLMIIIIFFSTAAVPDENNNKDRHETRPIENQTVITLDIKTQKLADIQTARLISVNHKTEFTAHGKAITFQPLLALRNRYLVALAEHNLATEKFKQAGESLNRQQELYRHGVTSKRLLQNQQIQWQNDKSQLDASSFQVQLIHHEVLLNWGPVLAEWGLSTNFDKLGFFLSGQQALLQIIIPANKTLPDNSKTILVELSGDRSKARPATFISKAPQTDASEQGIGYFFRTTGSNIGTGMKVIAWIPEKDQNQSGVMIPKSALIWSLGQAFVYIKTGEEKFSRRVISDYSDAADGYFTLQDLKPGEEIVTTGAQLLMSEELREQIPHEQDND